jgi:hypothetical protein
VACDVREMRDMDRLGSHCVWPVSLVPPISRGYPMGMFQCIQPARQTQRNEKTETASRPPGEIEIVCGVPNGTQQTADNHSALRLTRLWRGHEPQTYRFKCCWAHRSVPVSPWHGIYRTTSTEQLACCTTRVDTLPMRNRAMAPSPWAPITIRSAFCREAAFLISSAGFPR